MADGQSMTAARGAGQGDGERARRRRARGRGGVRGRADGGRGREPDRRRRWTSARRARRRTATGTARGSGRRGRARSSCAIPRLRPGLVLPELPGAAQAGRAGAGRGRAGGLRQRRLDAQGRPVGRAAGRRRHEQEPGLAPLRAAWTSRSSAFRERPLEGRYPYLWLDAKIERVREPRRRASEVPGDRLRACTRPAGAR